MNDNRNFPNLFWPLIFIGMGLLLFFANTGVIEAIDYSILWRLWPVFLVLVGMNMLFGRRTRWLAGLLSAVLALAVIAFLYFSPDIIQKLPAPEMVSEAFAEPLEGADRADVTLDFDRGNLEVGLLDDSALLFDAAVVHNEDLSFQSSGSSSRSVRLELDDIGTPQLGDLFNEQAQVRAEIGLTGEVPLALVVDIGGGNADLHLEDLLLESLKANSGSGGFEVVLPSGDYPVKLGSGSGNITIASGEDSNLDIKAEVGSGRITLILAGDAEGEVRLESGSGDISLTLPEGLAVQFEGSTGSGSIRLPQDFVRISSGDGLSGNQGVWQSPGFTDAAMQVFIYFEIGSGSLRVAYP